MSNTLRLVSRESGNKAVANIINFHEIPLGKHKFRATIGLLPEDYDCYETIWTYPKEYVYTNLSFENLEIYINGNWFNVECCEDWFFAPVGRKYAKLNLTENDRVEFSAIVKDDDIRFSLIEIEKGKFRGVTSPSIAYDILPKYYKGNVIVNMARTINSNKHKYPLIFSVKDFLANIYTLYKMGMESLYFKGRCLKHLSNFKKLLISSN